MIKIDLPENLKSDPSYECSENAVPIIFSQGNMVIAENNTQEGTFTIPLIPVSSEVLKGIERGIRKLKDMDLKEDIILCIFDGAIGLGCSDIQKTNSPIRREIF